MTVQQRKAIGILNNLRTEKNDDGTPVMSEDDYFFLLDFVIRAQEDVRFVPQVIPTQWPLPGTVQPYYEQPGIQRWEITCKTGQQ